MPAIFHRPHDRRAFLRISAVGAAALICGGRRSAGADSPAATASELHLALLSDTHVPGDRVNGHRGFNPWENLRRILPEVAAVNSEGVVICGDAARLEGKPEDYIELKALLEPLAAKAPVYIALGNHDHRPNFLKTFAPPAGAPSPVKDRQVLVVEHAATRVVVLDSLLQPNQVPGHLGKAQREWLAGWLPKNADRPVVLFVHHTLEDGDGDLLDSDRLFALIRPHGHVKAIFYGHSHVWGRKERDGLKLINLPAVGYNFADKDPVGWVDARFRRDGVSLVLRAFAGNRAEDGQTFEVKWA